jgi:hypothetical protein
VYGQRSAEVYRLARPAGARRAGKGSEKGSFRLGLAPRRLRRERYHEALGGRGAGKNRGCKWKSLDTAELELKSLQSGVYGQRAGRALRRPAAGFAWPFGALTVHH